MLKYEIGNIKIKINSNTPFHLERLSSFASHYSGEPDLTINIKSCENIQWPRGELVLDDTLKWLRKPATDGGFTVIQCYGRDDDIISLLDADKQWKNMSFTGISMYQSEQAIDRLFGSLAFRNCILNHGGIVIHASAIEHNGKGILFSAPAGTGKSTQARLWETYMGVRVLNDDCPAVRLLDGKPYVFGTPWSGSTDKYINGKASLSAIIMLEQAPQNSIHRLNKLQAITSLMPRSFLPYYDSSLMDIAISNLERIIDCTPIYLFRCRPDKQAVELVYECVK